MPSPSPETQTLIVTEGDADAIVTRLYRRFKDWSARGFGPDDVTWCEVKADVEQMIATHAATARQEGREEAALVVDQCNREGPYNAIGAAARIRALNDDTILGAARPAPPNKLHRRIAAARMVLGMSTLQTRFADRDGEWSLSALFNDIEANLSPIPPRPDQEELERQARGMMAAALREIGEDRMANNFERGQHPIIITSEAALTALVKALGGVR